MKFLYKYQILVVALIVSSLSSCVTGNDNSVVLKEHEELLATTPRVLDFRVNEAELTRDSLSQWEFIMVDPGDQIQITGTLTVGEGATTSSYFITRYYYHTATSYVQATTADVEAEEVDINKLDDSAPLDQSIGANTSYSFIYTVPAVDDEDFDFASGDHINISFWSTNDIGGVGFVDFTLEYN